MKWVISPLLLLLCSTTSLAGESDIVFNFFQYGSEYKNLSSISSPIKFIGPSKSIREVCEGDSFLLQCPKETFIKLAKNSAIQFGRNGEWEPKTSCGPGQRVDHCTTVNGKKQILSMCQGKEVCGIHLYGFFKGKDPCPAKDRNWGEKNSFPQPRKYLSIRFSCEKADGFEATAEKTESLDSSTPSIADMSTSSQTEGYIDDTEQLENALFDKLDALTEINEDAKEYVSEFLEMALNDIQHRSALDDSPPQSTLLNMTERISNKLMGMLDSQEEINEFEVETSQNDS